MISLLVVTVIGALLLAGGAALLPAMFAIAVAVGAIWLVCAMFGLVFRLIGFAVAGAIGIFFGVIGLTIAAVAGAGVVVAFGFALLPLVLPLLLIAAIVWALTRTQRAPTSTQTTSA